MKRHKHSLSFYRLVSMDMGALVPIGWIEALPGDTIQHATSALVRAAPLVSPVMHPINVRIHHWFVPYRLIWSEWEDFITGGPSGVSLPTFPTIDFSGATVTVGALADYIGVPTGTALPAATTISALPFRAYNAIWNQNYRDEDLETSRAFSTAGGNDTTTVVGSCANVSWEKDYFTSARPWEQKGPAITIPLGTSATVKTNASHLVSGAQPAALWKDNAGGAVGVNLALGFTAGSAMAPSATAIATGGATVYPSNLFADLSGASAITVTALRQALALQRFEEARARYGSRYVEYLRYLGVRSSDARLQRPEYLGGGKQTIQFSEVLQTGPSASPDQANVVGALKGHGIGALRSNRYRRFIEEHGLIMSFMSIRPKTMYMDGINRALLLRTKEEFWQKELEHIGQQAITNREIYAFGASPAATWGYQDRYDHLRRQESGVSGEFRSTLNYWHLARSFGSQPALNSSFVSCVPTLRTFASATTDPFYVMANHSIQARRMVAARGNSYIF